MNVIFLDIDGVLNSDKHFEEVTSSSNNIHDVLDFFSKVFAEDKKYE